VESKDNPFKAGTPEWRDWEHINVLSYTMEQKIAAEDIADVRIEKVRLAYRAKHEKGAWVDELLKDLEETSKLDKLHKEGKELGAGIVYTDAFPMEVPLGLSVLDILDTLDAIKLTPFTDVIYRQGYLDVHVPMPRSRDSFYADPVSDPFGWANLSLTFETVRFAIKRH